MVELQGRELTRILLTVIVIGGLIAASLWILRPFLGAIIWATMIVVATLPQFLALQRRVGRLRWAAVTVMSLIRVLLLIAPLSAAIGTIVAVRGAARRRACGHALGRRGGARLRAAEGPDRSLRGRPDGVVRRRDGQLRRDLHPAPAHRGRRRGALRARRTRGRLGAALRRTSRRHARRSGGTVVGAVDPRRGAGRRGHGAGAGADRRRRPVDRGCALRGAADG